jgi:hypothetical protein
MNQSAKDWNLGRKIHCQPISPTFGIVFSFRKCYCGVTCFRHLNCSFTALEPRVCELFSALSVGSHRTVHAHRRPLGMPAGMRGAAAYSDPLCSKFYESPFPISLPSHLGRDWPS